MNNIEKKLDALIDALGFDVEEVDHITHGKMVKLGFMAVDSYSGDREWEYFPDEEVYKEVLSKTDYKLTKRVHLTDEQTQLLLDAEATNWRISND